MLHDLAMRYLTQQRSEQLIAEAARHNLAAAARPSHSRRIGRAGSWRWFTGSYRRAHRADPSPS
jgi:hypothetical protein